MKNVQFANVGNKGDIKKHALVAALAKRLAGSAATWVDTHTFVLTAPCRNPHWATELEELERSYAGFGPYRFAQRRLGEGSPYRCSSAIALELLQPARLLLAERDAIVRGLLVEQLTELDLHDNRVPSLEVDLVSCTEDPTISPASEPKVEITIDDSAVVLLSRSLDRAGPLLGLVDPFRFDDVLRSQLKDAIARWAHPAFPTAFVVFHYEKRPAYEWPVLEPLGRPVARWSEQPFHLALYASRDFAQEARAAARSVGYT